MSSPRLHWRSRISDWDRRSRQSMTSSLVLVPQLVANHPTLLCFEEVPADCWICPIPSTSQARADGSYISYFDANHVNSVAVGGRWLNGYHCCCKLASTSRPHSLCTLQLISTLCYTRTTRFNWQACFTLDSSRHSAHDVKLVDIDGDGDLDVCWLCCLI